jgi:protein-ribulosamine 3-kinase
MSWLVSCSASSCPPDAYSPEMPPGTTIKGIHAHGASYWSRTAEIQTLKNDGSPQSYYIKVFLVWSSPPRVTSPSAKLTGIGDAE